MTARKKKPVKRKRCGQMNFFGTRKCTRLHGHPGDHSGPVIFIKDLPSQDGWS